MTTHTRVHTTITFANPHLICMECGQPATGYHNSHYCGCGAAWWLHPCRHQADTRNANILWSPTEEETDRDRAHPGPRRLAALAHPLG